jgi:coproporphyrinogen III oxidase-like Fe-S oxidoreductase
MPRGRIRTISLDLCSLCRAGRDSWRETLRAHFFGAEHLSCYALTIEGNTLFARRVSSAANSFPWKTIARLS